MSGNVINIDNTSVSNESDDYKMAKNYKSYENSKNFKNKHHGPDNVTYRNTSFKLQK